jgi:hypothetical protein
MTPERQARERRRRVDHVPSLACSISDTASARERIGRSSSSWIGRSLTVRWGITLSAVPAWGVVGPASPDCCRQLLERLRRLGMPPDNAVVPALDPVVDELERCMPGEQFVECLFVDFVAFGEPIEQGDMGGTPSAALESCCSRISQTYASASGTTTIKAV